MTRINIKSSTHGSIQDQVKWLDKNVGPRRYYLHTEAGGEGWRYFPKEHTVEIEDDSLATMFALKFG